MGTARSTSHAVCQDAEKCVRFLEMSGKTCRRYPGVEHVDLDPLAASAGVRVLAVERQAEVWRRSGGRGADGNVIKRAQIKTRVAWYPRTRSKKAGVPDPCSRARLQNKLLFLVFLGRLALLGLVDPIEVPEGEHVPRGECDVWIQLRGPVAGLAARLAAVVLKHTAHNVSELRERARGKPPPVC